MTEATDIHQCLDCGLQSRSSTVWAWSAAWYTAEWVHSRHHSMYYASTFTVAHTSSVSQ